MNRDIKSWGIQTVNPATGADLAFHPFIEDNAVDGVLQRAALGFETWRDMGMAARLELLKQFGAAIESAKENLARQASIEMGKPITQSLAEIDRCVQLTRWIVENTPRILTPREVNIPTGRAWLRFDPVGTVFGITPWNFPFYQIIRAAVPIMAGGNGYLVKPAECTMQCGLMLNDIAASVGMGDVFIAANFRREQSRQIIQDKRIAGVALTGSVAAGRAISQLAGEAGKKTVMELGGSDPFIILADADLEKAVDGAVASRFGNAGQVCIAAKRFIIDESIAEDFSDRFAERIAAIQPGDPLDRETFLGPMSRIDLRDALHKQVQMAVKEGAKLVVGGSKPRQPGAWYAPTLLTDVTPEMACFREELFGPVACVIVAKDTDDAIRLANDSDFGLSSSLWTKDLAKAERLAGEIEAGAVNINKGSSSDPNLPIGGIKASGYGRELTEFGLLEFMNIKPVWAAT
ncbi:Succinate dehydrogenase [Acetobacteraceae bacterium EV16G]|uniref:Succinate dehydrogenase n=1 Tax=Sorlinia euscelidii TaxID=3081148 RepID=A0ABU7U2Q7_9PROT